MDSAFTKFAIHEEQHPDQDLKLLIHSSTTPIGARTLFHASDLYYNVSMLQ